MQPNELFDAARAVVAQLLDTGFLADDDRAASDLIRAVLQIENAALRSQLDLLHADYAQAIADVAALTAERDSLRTAPPFALPAPAKPARQFRAKEQTPDQPLPCDHCDRTFKNRKALGAHRKRTHGAAPLPRPTIRLVVDELPFVCPVCKSDAHTRDLHQIDRCVRCAKRGAA